MTSGSSCGTWWPGGRWLSCTLSTGRTFTTVLSLGEDGQLLLTDLVCGHSRKLCQHRGAVHSMALSASHTQVLSCGEDGAVRLSDLRVGGEAGSRELLTLREKARRRRSLFSVAQHPLRESVFAV